MTIQELATPVFKAIINWTNVILLLLIFYKLGTILFAVLGKAGLKIPGFGGNKDKDEDNTVKKRKKEKEDKDKFKKEQEDIKKILEDAGLDTKNKGKVRFRVIDVNGNPLMRVLVVCWPKGISKKQSKKLKKLIEAQRSNLTMPDGFTNNFMELYAGDWQVQAIKYHYSVGHVFNKLNKNILWNSKSKNKVPYPVLNVKANEEQIFEVTMLRDVETGESPMILNYKDVPEKAKKNTNKVKLVGKIN